MRLNLSRQQPTLLDRLHVGRKSLIAGAATAAAVGGVALQRFMSQGNETPETIASFTAAAVADAARGEVLEAIDHASDRDAAVAATRNATRLAVREAASAGADITAAAIGAVQGARMSHSAHASRARLRQIAGEAAVEAADAIGPAAGQRVQKALRETERLSVDGRNAAAPPA